MQVVSTQVPQVLSSEAALLCLESLRCTIAAKDSEVAEFSAKNTAIKEEATRMRHKLEAAELRVKICTRDYNDLFKRKTSIEEAHAKALRDLAKSQKALKEKDELLMNAQSLQEETKQTCLTVTSCLADEYAKLQGELDVTRMRLAPYLDEEEDKEVAYLDTNLIPQLEEEQREKVKALFESHIAALKEILEKPRGPCGASTCPRRRRDPDHDDGAADNQKKQVNQESQTEVDALTMTIVPSSSTLGDGVINEVALSNVTYELNALKLQLHTTKEALQKSQAEEKKLLRYKSLYLEQVKEAKKIAEEPLHPNSTTTLIVPNTRAEIAANRNQEQLAQDEEMARRMMQGDLLQRFESEVKVLKDAATASSEQLAEYKSELDILQKLYDDANKSLAHYRELSWAKGEADKTGRMVLRIWLNMLRIELPVYLRTAHEVYTWDIICLAMAISRGIERFNLPMPLTVPMMELLWMKGNDQLRALVAFALLQGDLYTSGDPNKMNLIAGDLAIWQVLYYIRLQYRTIESNRRQLPSMGWTNVTKRYTAEKSTAGILRSKVNQTLWEAALKYLAEAQQLCVTDSRKAIADLALVLQNEPAESNYRVAQVEHLVEFVKVHYAQIVAERKPFIFNMSYVQEFHITELRSAFNEMPENKAIMDAREAERRARAADATSALTDQ